MNMEGIKFGLQEIRRNFEPILDDNAGWILEDAITQLERTKAEFDIRRKQTHDPRLIPESWGYQIGPDYPLRFEPQKIRGKNLWTDLYCTALWKEEEALPVKQCIHLRVWSDEIDLIYREDLDSQDVYTELTDEGRVMLRFHFDLANPGQPGPEYHLQFGGKPQANELCWFPEFINLPRLPYPPMDLILVCQMLAANFYWEEYITFHEASEWRHALRSSQKYLLQGYYEGCLSALNQDLLVDYLWNSINVEE